MDHNTFLHRITSNKVPDGIELQTIGDVLSIRRRWSSSFLWVSVSVICLIISVSSSASFVDMLPASGVGPMSKSLTLAVTALLWLTFMFSIVQASNTYGVIRLSDQYIQVGKFRFIGRSKIEWESVKHLEKTAEKYFPWYTIYVVTEDDKRLLLTSMSNSGSGEWVANVLVDYFEKVVTSPGIQSSETQN